MSTTKTSDEYQRINELVLDEEKIVTAISLANELNISTIKAQTLLNDFVKDFRKSNNKEIYPTYLLGGTSKNGKGGVISVLKEEELKKKKEVFEDTLIEIVYSVQAFKQVDLNAIASVNASYDIREPLFTSKNSVKRNLPERKIIAPTTHQSTTKLIKTFSRDDSTNASKSTNNQAKKTNKTNNAFSSFFTKGPVKTEDISTQNKFGNNSEKKNEPKKSPPKAEPKVENGSEKEKSPERKIETSSTSKSEIQKKNKDKKRKKQGQSGGQNKKRKRIQEICDSDSSDMFDDEENEKSTDIVDISEEEEQKPSVVQNVTPVTKSKKRKAIDKTYEEDGFVVTKTEFVYESESEEEVVAPKIKPEVLAEKKNDKLNGEVKAKPGKGKGNKKETNSKQPTLMSFFKKT